MLIIKTIKENISAKNIAEHYGLTKSGKLVPIRFTMIPILQCYQKNDSSASDAEQWATPLIWPLKYKP